MSYILDALRKSESERRQGRVPDLGQQVQLIHKPKKKSSALAMWIGAGLVLNATVLAVLFWPEPAPVVEPALAEETPPESRASEPGAQEVQKPEEPAATPIAKERPTIIVPSRETDRQPVASETSGTFSGTVPHLVEMPLAFQKTIPDLVFNSHIYASEPSSRRVMINNNYLRAGESFSGIRVERITEEGIVLSKNGRPFRVGIVRDWASPE
jgi:general secretion pathway protein B